LKGRHAPRRFILLDGISALPLFVQNTSNDRSQP
jgi:hypothetical protein